MTSRPSDGARHLLSPITSHGITRCSRYVFVQLLSLLPHRPVQIYPTLHTAYLRATCSWMAATDDQWPSSPFSFLSPSSWTPPLHLPIDSSASPASSHYCVSRFLTASPFSLLDRCDDDNRPKPASSFLLTALSSTASLPSPTSLDHPDRFAFCSPHSLPTPFPADHPGASPPIPPRKRRRRAPLAVLKSHKEIDALRRAKEEAVLQRLETLTAPQIAEGRTVTMSGRIAKRALGRRRS